MSEVGPELAALLTDRIRDVPDWPSPGILFKDIGPLLADPAAFAGVVEAFASGNAGERVDIVAGVEARGFILAAPVADRLGTGFVAVRKRGKLPGATLRAAYSLEYGTDELEIGADLLPPDSRVLVIDDVLATGGTLAATVGLIRRAGAHVTAVAVLLELVALGGRERLADLLDETVELRALLQG